MNEEVQTLPTINTLISAKPGDRRGAIYRVLHVDPENDLIALMRVEPEFKRRSRMPILKSLSFLRTKKFIQIPDTIRLPIMGENDDRIGEKLKEQRDARLRVIEPLVESGKHLQLLNSEERARRIRQRSVEANVKVQRIYLLLTTFWWFGCDKNALLPLHERKGAPGVSRFGGDTKKGAPNANKRLNPLTKDIGVNVGKKDIPLFLRALKKYWVDDDLSLAATYRKMRNRIYIRAQYKDGKKTLSGIKWASIPTAKQFERHARKLIDKHGLRKKKIDDIDYQQYFAPRDGSASDICRGPGDIYDIDGTPFNFHLCIEIANQLIPIGKPTVIFVVDRGSNAIVGVYVTLQSETWSAYMQALYCAFTDKTDLLKKCGYEGRELETAWPLHHLCNGVFGDRGPLRSEAALEALAKRLKMKRSLAPTDRGDLKGVVEGVNNIMQRKLAENPGGYIRSTGRRAQFRADSAADSARLESNEFRELLVDAIVEYNKTSNAGNRLTRTMLANGVKPFPEAIFIWGTRQAPGNYLNHRQPSELYKDLLESVEVTVSREGVRWKKMQLSSQELRASGRMEKRSGKSAKLTAYRDPFDPRRLLWQPDSQRWDTLIPRRSDADRYGEVTLDNEIELLSLSVTAERNLIEKRKIKKGKITREQRDILASANARDNVVPFPAKVARKSGLSAKARKIAERAEAAENSSQVLKVLKAQQAEDPVQPPSQGVQEREASEVAYDDAAKKALESILGRNQD